MEEEGGSLFVFLHLPFAVAGLPDVLTAETGIFPKNPMALTV